MPAHLERYVFACKGRLGDGLTVAGGDGAIAVAAAAEKDDLVGGDFELGGGLAIAVDIGASFFHLAFGQDLAALG